MAETANQLFRRIAAAMKRRNLARLDGAEGAATDVSVTRIERALAKLKADPTECLLAAAAAGLFPQKQPPARLADDASRNRFLLEQFERRDYRVRPARLSDLAALMVLERRCWARALRTPKAVLERRIARDPKGQLALVVDGTVVGVIYSQCIERADVLDGVSAAQVDALHRPDGKVVQFLAINVLPEMQQRALGDQLLEFMLITRSLQRHVSSVVAITRCKNFATHGGEMSDYIRLRNAQGVLADPVLRFHELHGATIDKVMPGYRPDDTDNAGCGVLVRYDIRRRRRKVVRTETSAPQAGWSRTDIARDVANAITACLAADRKSGFAADRPLMEMGLDSADLLSLSEQLTLRYRLRLSPTFFFQYDTTDKIVAHLCEHFAVDATASGNPAAQTAHKRRTGRAAQHDIAIVGMACRLPGGINTPEDLWDCLVNERSVIGGLPPGRFDWPEGIDPVGRHKGIDRGGFLDDVAAFDAPFFRISPTEAESMDPQQRMLLELSWHAIEHAGYAADKLAASRTGVFIGASGSDYARLIDQARGPTEAHHGTGNSMAVLANRLSYFYDLRGPSLLIDTACSSSLVAVHEAARALASGECTHALVGGINLILHPATSIAYHKAGMLSRDGLCRTFDAAANGYVRSEGAVVLLLKPLRTALADNDRIHAVIKGTACNHGGQVSGLTVPNPERQAQLIQAAWRAANIDPLAVSYIEAHGTGTSLGDPVETQGIVQAFDGAVAEAGGRRPAPCALGSVKSNLGHLEAAAGLAGLLKTVLCLRHWQLPASVHFRQLNPHIDLGRHSLSVVDRLQEWSSDGPRLAGVSSFGSGGANAHVVVAEHVADEPASEAAHAPALFVLSAKTPQQLREYARRYADWLASDIGASASLHDLTRQLQTGRQAMEARLALVVGNHAELIGALSVFCSDETLPKRDPQFAAMTDGDAGRKFVHALASARDLKKLATLWQAGAEIDWSLLHAKNLRQPLAVSPPGYPFAKHVYWLPNVPAPQPKAAPSEDKLTATLLAPFWQRIDDNHLTAPPPGRTLVIDPAASIETLTERLRTSGELDHIVWTAPASDGDLLARQESWLIHVFRLAKALLAQYRDRRLDWTVITRKTQQVFGRDSSDPADAGVHGFLGALANEIPRWRTRLVDLDDNEDAPLADIVRLPLDRSGDVLARRSGQWFRRRFGPVAELPPALPPYRQNGVYVVIGGAGGIGEAWARHVVERYRAQVIWIGRRQQDEAITAKIEAIRKLGPPPIYIAADATDRASLQGAHDTIKRRFSEIHGVIHAAVGAFDRSIAETDEQYLRDVLSAKIEASVHTADVFGNEPLDFLLYFSSVVALEKNGGLSGYAAGGAFEDAFALHLGAQRSYPTKVINWGHWAVGTGATISGATKMRQQQSGFVTIEPNEAMAALDQFLAAPFAQAAVLKSSRLNALPFVDLGASLHVHAGHSLPPDLPDTEQWGAQVEALKPLSIFNNAALEDRLLPLFAATLESLSLRDATELPRGAPAFYRRWLAASRSILNERAASTILDIDAVWRDWDKAKRELASPDLAAAIDLAEACLRALPDILSGSTRATDIIFPGSSMRRVEGVYRDNAVADYFNQMLAASLTAAVEQRITHDADARIRILEVGAGTGGTTAIVLPPLEPYRRNIAEYAYTDISKAFLFQAEERFVPQYPFVQPRIFDAERPLDGQNIEAGAYDIVIATNVLHATRDIRRTLGACKAALRKGGLLLLNELSGRSLFAHLTFGLLEGWWLPDDCALRIPDSPGLYPERWREVLSQEGFGVALPVPEAHALGQQIIVAQSDGVVWQRQATQSAAKPAVGLREEPQPAIAPGSDGSVKQATNAYLRQLVARTLRMDAADIGVREPLEAYGIDSILVVQITEALRETFADVRSTLLFECQTIDALGDHLIANNGVELAKLTGTPATNSPRASAAVPAMPPVATREHDAVAVIGMSCRFPQADNTDDYWRVLASGQNCIREVPPERWPLDDFFDPDPDEAIRLGKSYSKWGGFIDGVTEFDPQFFGILPRDAAAIDPQERLFLQTAWEAIEDAGYTRESLARVPTRKTGVFVGITRTGFDLFGPELWRRGETVYPHTSFSSVANRLSYFLNAHGPSVPVDTMCSSSLTAIHQACQSLHAGECEVAIAGGVNIYLHPSGYVGLSAARMLSRDGVCRSFGKGGNGFVPGEGVAAILLKPLSRAIADGDQIYATIRATHVNHGGKTNGYTVPNPLAQADLVRDALLKAGIDARDVGYVEAHGTGTELGDPIEVTGLTQAFRHFTRDVAFCALGSAKSNIGHLEAAAGIASFIKAVLQLRHRQLVPSLHAAELNPNIDFGKTPFVMQRELAEWRSETLRLAAVSSFGAGGANAHVIVEEYWDETRSVDDGQAHIIVLSARSEDRLKAYAGRIHDFMSAQAASDNPPALRDVAYTLQIGREPMDHRVAFVAHSLAEVREKLRAYLDSAISADVQTGHAKRNKELIGACGDDNATQAAAGAWFARGEYQRLATLWAKGLSVDWERLHRESGTAPTPRRISLPTYPFARMPYWLPVNAEPTVKVETTPVLPPQSLPLASSVLAKPNAIRLRDPAIAPTTFPVQAKPQPIVLRSTAPREIPANASTASAASIAVRDLDNGVLAIDLDDAAGASVAAVKECVAWINTSGQRDGAKVLLVRGSTRALSSHDMPSALAASALPTIATVPDGSAKACDITVAGDDTAARALEVARNIARAPAKALSALKRHLQASSPIPPGDGLDAGFSWTPGFARAQSSQIALKSDVATVTAHANGVAVIQLHDRAAKNTSSPAFVQGVMEAFAQIRATPDYKAVVLTGYDSYFACGGTRDGLLAIQCGKARFTDEQSYAEPLTCEIPVIAAMQGHAIGAGWTMGLYCDAAIYSEESIYQSPYLLYGFTPGAGSTLMFPHRFGRNLSSEILFTAQEFRGRDLRARGVASVFPRDQVFDYALALANHLALASRDELVRQKNERARSIRERLQATFAQELALHDATFVGNADVVAGIAQHFNDAAFAREDSPVAPTNTTPPHVLDTLRQSLAEELHIAAAEVDDAVAFVDIGIDSISAVTWVRKTNKQFSLSLAATSIYSHPTLAQFAAFVAAQLGAKAAPLPAPGPAAKAPAEPRVVYTAALHRDAEPEPAPRAQSATTTTSPIAIIGMAGQFPMAGDVNQFWRNLIEGRDCVSDIPPSRWSIEAYHDAERQAPGKTVCRRMGALDDIDVFDPLFFSLSPSEAELMDPQQRLFLQNSWRCIEDAGYDPTTLSGSLCGVFVGCAVSDYAQLITGQPPSAHGLIGESVSVLPARISYFLNLRGPSLAIDTACSASLVAIANACDSLVLGNSDAALAGGVYVINGPDIHVKMSKAGMLSENGRCFTFDQRANGFVPGEGVGVLMLKRLADAERDGDDIYAVIRGWGVNQDGKTNGITAPSQHAQARLEAGIYRKFGIDPAEIGLIEAHGTGTKLGDPIEVEALRDAFGQFTRREQFCALGSAKSNIGHLATAAGVAGVVKSVLALQHQQLPPTINYEALNEHIKLQGSPFYVNTRAQAWSEPAGHKRMAAVSSFGFSGTNAHVVIEERTAPRDSTAAPDTPIVLPLSAKSAEQLARYAQAVNDYLAENHDSAKSRLPDIAHTFQSGRPAMNHRLAVVARNIGELRARLNAYLAGTGDEHCFAGEAGKTRAGADRPTSASTQVDITAIAARWVAGEPIDWSTLARRPARRLHGLPSYPFARERYWVPQAEVSKPDDEAAARDIDRGIWHASELPRDIDWQSRLHACLGQRILVVSDDDAQRRAFEGLLAKLKESAAIASSDVTYCDAPDPGKLRAVAQTDCAIILGSPSHVDLLKALRQLQSSATLLILVQIDTESADRLGAAIAAEAASAAPQCLLVSQSDDDVAAGMQRLFKEWLALDALEHTALSEVHYAGAERLIRAAREDRHPDQIALIRKDWIARAAEPAEGSAERGTAIVLANADSLSIAHALFRPGDFEHVVLIADTGNLGIDFTDANAAKAGTQSLLDRHDDITHIIDLTALHDTPRDEDAEPWGRIAFYQALIANCDSLSILAVTKGLQAFRTKRPSLAGTKTAGLIRMLSADYRHVDARLVDIDDVAVLRSVVLREFGFSPRETEICYRGGQRYVPTLAVSAANTRDAPPEIDPNAVYVVSGGTNGTGLEIAKHLARKGCRKLVLMGITPLPPKAKWPQARDEDPSPYVRTKLRELVALDRTLDHLEIYTGPLTDRHSLRRAFVKVRATLGPIRGVIHAAGAYSDATTPGFADKVLTRMQQVWEPKAAGLESLHAVFKADPLDFFATFTSMTALVPHLARGAADYAMANAYAELFTAHQNRENGGTRYRTVAWSDWNETGATTRIGEAKAASIKETFDNIGLRTFTNQEGCALFDRALAETGSHVVIGYVDAQRFGLVRDQLLQARPEFTGGERFEASAAPQALSAIAVKQHIEALKADKRAGIEISIEDITDAISLDEIKRLDPALIHEIHALLFGAQVLRQAQPPETDYARVIATAVKEVLKLKSLDPAQPFQNYGLDSISATILATRLEKRLAREIPPQWLIEFPSVEALSHHLRTEDGKLSQFA
jgi:acyl transferase domain-containing protein/enoyl-CoA hydratase/carnithine racemase/acyl carrier protein/SAM-dependent methyltransferase